MDRAQQGLCILIDSQIFPHPAQSYSGNKHFIIRPCLLVEGGRAGAEHISSRPYDFDAYGSHMGLFYLWFSKEIVCMAVRVIIRVNIVIISEKTTFHGQKQQTAIVSGLQP